MLCHDFKDPHTQKFNLANSIISLENKLIIVSSNDLENSNLPSNKRLCVNDYCVKDYVLIFLCENCYC